MKLQFNALDGKIASKFLQNFFQLFSGSGFFFVGMLSRFSSRLFKSRFAVLAGFIFYFISASFIVRSILLILSWKKGDLSVIQLPEIFGKGLLFDLTIAILFCLPYSIYLLLLPQKWNGSIIDKLITYIAFYIAIFICTFSFCAEITFWLEFETRFNFIAVDYLVYTYEVIHNINESYPLQYLIPAMMIVSLLIVIIFSKISVFRNLFISSTTFKTRAIVIATGCTFGLVMLLSLANSWAEKSRNRYVNELSKDGIFSFFAAFKNNELDFYEFYNRKSEPEVFASIRKELDEANSRYINNSLTICREIDNTGEQIKPNVIMVTLESFSAEFMTAFGNSQHLTPNLDSIASHGVLFTDMYSTGTRTVRGLEALSLSIPPTPGNSIVRRKDNDHLFTIGSVFNKAGYSSTFFYGGDGYFDNMNEYFGNNGYNIIDRGHSLTPGEQFSASRKKITDDQVHFENAWGICDEDLYDAVIRQADENFAQSIPFYDFVMTTSNHRPYTYPAGKIDIPSGSGREGAVKYTDYAIGKFMQKIRSKSWFSNTVIIFVADHCASSAGKNEITISNYHIPCIIYNLRGVSGTFINTLCSQIDVYPTLFSLMNWDYESNFFGKNVLAKTYQPRALVSTYQKLGYLENDELIVLSPQHKSETYKWERASNEQKPAKVSEELTEKSISFYQTAYYLYKHGGLSEEQGRAIKNRLSK